MATITSAIIRRATASDLPVILNLLRAYFAEWNILCREPEAEVLAAINHPTLGYFLAERHGRLMGCVLLRPLPAIPAAAECKRLYVLPEARGQGIASQLMETAEAYTLAAGLEWLYLDSKSELTAAIDLYRRRGYEEIPRFNDNAEATIFFRKLLSR